MRKLFLCVIAMVCALSASAEGGIGRAVERIPFRMPEEYSDETPVMFAVRTNLLVPALNIGAEVPIGGPYQPTTTIHGSGQARRTRTASSFSAGLPKAVTGSARTASEGQASGTFCGTLRRRRIL